jgi:hypothetical protein
MRGKRLLGVVLAGLVALLGRPPDARAGPGGYHQDDRLGYKVRAPQDWTQVPIGVDEAWIAAKFLSDKAYFYTDKTDGWTFDHKPMMRVISFVDEVVRKRIEKSEGENSVLIQINNPYKDYEDYLQRTYSGGGWYISEDEAGEVRGIPVRKLEIKVEKLAQGGPRRLVAWVFHTDDVDLAVDFEVLEGSYAKLKGHMLACLKSFQLVPRTKGSLAPTTTGGPTLPIDEEKLTPEERKKRRQDRELAHHRKAAEGLPAGWEAKKMGPFLVLNHADEKYAKKVVAHAEAVLAWLDENLAFIGPGEYVPAPVIRICANRDEEDAFRGGDWWGSGGEIVTHKDSGAGAMSYEFEYVNRRILGIWFSHRDPDLFQALPYWLDEGLAQVLGTARSKGRKLEFQPDEWERDGLRDAVRQDKVTPPSALMKLGREEFFQEQSRSKEAAALCRFLLTGPASKNRATKTILKDYLICLKEVVGEIDAERAKEQPAEKPPETEAEEDERFRNRKDGWKAQESKLLEETWQRAFGSWDEKAWKTFENLYLKCLE